MSNPSRSDRASEWVVTFLGLGKLPLARGTWGTLGAVAVHALVARQIGTADHPWVLPVLAGTFALANLAYGPWAEAYYGRKDPHPFVLDEVAGYFLVVSFFPAWPQLHVGLLGFFFFRVFDVVKPFPARRAEKLPGGAGILLDDLIAGLYAALFVWLAVLAFAPR